jgi:hypothetical protein
MRNIVEVINQIITVVPLQEPDLIRKLEKLTEDSWYQAPESNLYWFKLHDVLMGYIDYKNIQNLWEFQVFSIFSTMRLEEVIENYCTDFGYEIGETRKMVGLK